MSVIYIQNSTKPLRVGTIFCLGRNYAEHAKEMNAAVPETPVVFIKPSSAIIHSGEIIVRPSFSKQLHVETEIVVAIGTSGKNIAVENAHKYILGYAIGLDMTLRDVQSDAKKKGLPWATAKGFHTSAPVSEVIPTTQITDNRMLEFTCRVNGSQRQFGKSRDMLFSIEQTIAYLSSVFSLEEGDLIFTGTPEGVSEVSDGDIIEAELKGYTTISHTVRYANA